MNNRIAGGYAGIAIIAGVTLAVIVALFVVWPNYIWSLDREIEE